MATRPCLSSASRYCAKLSSLARVRGSKRRYWKVGDVPSSSEIGAGGRRFLEDGLNGGVKKQLAVVAVLVFLVRVVVVNMAVVVACSAARAE